MGRLDDLIAIRRLVSRIRELERRAPGAAVPELGKLLGDPSTSRAVIVPLLMALRRFGPAAAVVLPLVENLSRPGEAESVRRMAKSVIDAIRGNGGTGSRQPPEGQSP